MTEEPTSKGAVPNLALTNKEELVNVKLKGSLGCSDHEEVDFKDLRWILRGSEERGKKITTLDYERADFGIFKDLLSRVPWDRTVEGRAAQKGWMILKSCLLQVQLQCLLTKRKSRKKTEMGGQELLEKLEQLAYRGCKQGKEVWEEYTKIEPRRWLGKLVQAEVNQAKDVKGKKTEGSLGISAIKDRPGKMWVLSRGIQDAENLFTQDM